MILPMILGGARALITGSAKRVGRATALALGAEGARVVIHYGGSREAAEATATDVEAAGGEASTVQADLADPTEIDRLFQEVERLLGGLDLLVNNAASFESRPFDQITAEDWDRVLAVNLRAPFLCTQRAAALMGTGERAAPGLIVNITDLSALGVWRGYAHHSVAKAGLAHLTRVSAWELAPDVRVNAIAPGAILPPPGVDPQSPGWQKRGEQVPTGSVGSPELVAETILFLARNDFVNGAVVPLDGGEHLIQGGRE